MTTNEGVGEHVRNALQILRHVQPLEQNQADVAQLLKAVDERLTAAALRLAELRQYLNALPTGTGDLMAAQLLHPALMPAAVARIKAEL